MPGPNEKDVRINVIIDEDTRGAKKASKALEGTRKEAGKLDEQFKKTARSAKELDRELDVLVKQRAKAIEAGNVNERNGINRQIRFLRQLKKELAEADPVIRPSIGGRGRGGLMGAAMAAAPEIGGLGAPLIAGGISAVGGILAGSTVAVGLAGGIISAAKDDQVKAAARQFGKDIGYEFFGPIGGGGAFVQPIKDSLNTLRQGFRDMNLGTAFEKGADDVNVLAAGIADMGRNLMPGFNAAMDKSGTYTHVFSDGLADTGDALSDMLKDLTDTEGSVDGLRFAFMLLNGTIRTIGRVGEVSGDFFHNYTTGLAAITGQVEDVVGWVPLAGDAFRGMNDDLEEMSGTGDAVVQMLHQFNPATKEAAGNTSAAAQAAQDAAAGTERWRNQLQLTNAELSNQISQNLQMDQANLAVKQGWADLNEAIKENGKNYAANEGPILRQIDLLNDQRLEAIESSDGSVAAVDKVNQAFNKQVQKLLDIAKQAGASRAELERLEREYTIRIVTIEQGKQAVAWSEFRNKERAEGRAAGGPVMAGVPYTINEAGRETVTFPANGMVHPASLTPAMSSGGWRGGVTAAVMPGADQMLGQAILAFLQGYITLQGGDVQQSLGRSYS